MKYIFLTLDILNPVFPVVQKNLQQIATFFIFFEVYGNFGG
jgi:hypothetical protein